MLTIHLGQDENDCFAAWVSAKEAGINVTDDNLRGKVLPLFECLSNLDRIKVFLSYD